ncbi:polysaccharide export protein [Halothece sp. PCC 7418]|uniref:polysaccharide biosynthesis/export family protein n=1 Tax=Halothece sp. (strain PCC 7418) TaxID=65093 RepID=UPI0002A070DD|nr:SLBB domain-containing protein [Halothece sp. PCC 7418]AFZ44893.1 polysaccharide export protein [Halothece sp. PCC 7418]
MVITQNDQALQKQDTRLPDLPQVSSRWLMVALTTLISGYVGSAIPAQAQIPLQLQQPSPESEPIPAETSDAPFRYQETPYTLGPGDSISINIFNIPEYSGQYRISVDGRINLPIVGSVDVQGLTIPQANELITQRYTPILQRPIVSLSLAQPRPVRVAIAGEVNRPGSYDLSSGGGQQFPPITEAIKQAGGITRSANVRQVKLHRVYRGEPYVLNVNLWKLVEDGQIIQDVTLRDGDRIVIPTVSNNNPRETRLLSQSAIAPVSQAVEVAVVGEVSRPGSHQVSGGDSGSPPTVTQAIQAAGGITNLSDIRNIRVERSTRNGGDKILSANLWELLQEGKVSEDVLLQPGDTVVVPKATKVNPTEAEALASASFSPQTIRVNVLGETKRSGTLELPANTPLNQAILAAGGFNDRADKGEIELVRLNPNGTVTRREYEVDLNAGIDAESNPTLRNNDVIVVERSTLAAVGDTVGTILQPVSTIFQGIRFFDIFFGNN